MRHDAPDRMVRRFFVQGLSWERKTSREGDLSQQKKRPPESDLFSGAENETRTRDPNLGKVVLYQLSYFRKILQAKSNPVFRNGIAKIGIISFPANFF